MDNQQGLTCTHRELCSMLCGSLDGRGVWGKMDTYICRAEPLCCSPETITTSLIAKPTQNKKLKTNKLEWSEARGRDIDDVGLHSDSIAY